MKVAKTIPNRFYLTVRINTDCFFVSIDYFFEINWL